MPVTTMVDSVFGTFAIGDRTDNTGASVDDVSAEEARLLLAMFTEGWVEEPNSFLVQNPSGMNITIGSGGSKADKYIVPGGVQGQEKYLVRLDSTEINHTVPAADPSQSRTDEVYLIVLDGSYDAGSLQLPRIGYRRGDAGAGAPGPEAAWEAYALLATIPVGAGATSPGTIQDQRQESTLTSMPEIDLIASAIAYDPANNPSTTQTNVQGALTDMSARLTNIVTFTSSGTFSKSTYPDIKFVRVRLVGGGGAGGGTSGTSKTGAGGSGGGYSERLLTAASLGSSTTVTVGTGGSGSTGNNGGNGGTSSFGSHLSATGGQGGDADNGAGGEAGVGGVGSGGNFNARGQSGGRPQGGNSMFGGGAGGRASNQNGLSAGTNAYGAGGAGGASSGGTSTSRAGGSGRSGIVIVEVYR